MENLGYIRYMCNPVSLFTIRVIVKMYQPSAGVVVFYRDLWDMG